LAAFNHHNQSICRGMMRGMVCPTERVFVISVTRQWRGVMIWFLPFSYSIIYYSILFLLTMWLAWI